MSDKAVYRTAPATSGLLKTFFSSTKKMLITSNFVWEIWHYKIRVEDIDSAI